MKTVGEILQASTGFLQKKKIERARRLAEELIAQVLSIKRIDLYLQFDRPIVEEELDQIRPRLQRLASGEPIEYILGKIDFFGCAIRVDPRVLIPRQETEILLDHIVKRVGASQTAWDICTGSGCIGISLKKKLPALSVTLSDLSADALIVAEENARTNGVEVEILQGDLLTPFRGRKADLVAINPPYVSVNEYFSLDRSVSDFEPKMALIGGERGTEFYERLSLELPDYLNPGARVFLEIGSTQGEAVQKIFSSPVWKRQEVVLDWAGKTRFFFLELQ
jgi:release factor glutamine methyltransferase